MPKLCAIITSKSIFATKYLCMVASLVFFLTHTATASQKQAPEQVSTPDKQVAENLAPSDCIKCHPKIVTKISDYGEAHGSKVTCIDCHVGHPPAVRGIIPSCNKCHQDKAHFAIKNCLGCHTNPHTPLIIKLNRETTFPCTTCHDGQKEQLESFDSIHSTLDCTACHTRHGYLPPCFNCHGPHLEDMANEECKLCHFPHKPLEVTYPPDTPSEYCGACHEKVYALLAGSRAKHRQLLCSTCHKSVHKTIPQCTLCHPTPHSASILDNFTSCGDCHGIAHDLQLNKIDMFLEQR